MRLIRQKHESDCGIAVAAMIGGCAWKKASDADNGNCCRIGLSVNQFSHLCGTIGASVKVVRVSHATTLEDAQQPQGTCAALIRKEGTSRGHFVAIHGGDVLDPDKGRFAFSKYGRRKWLVLRWFVKA
jgi:ABC-type bacteriocin/lantibiotic exporter with double-glycine peptidase domain